MEGSRVLVCNGAASLLGTQSATLNTNGRLRGPWRNTATGRQTLPISSGPRSSATCSLLINRTHSARRVGVDTKPLPLRALGFSSYLRLCQLKRLYYDANSVECCGSSSVCVCGGGGTGRGVKEQTGYCIASVFPPIRDPPNTNRALGLAFLNTLWRGQELRIDRFLMALYFFFPPLLVLSGLCNVCEWIKVSCAAQRCGFVLLLVAQLPLWGGWDITWRADERRILFLTSNYRRYSIPLGV